MKNLKIAFLSALMLATPSLGTQRSLFNLQPDLFSLPPNTIFDGWLTKEDYLALSLTSRKAPSMSHLRLDVKAEKLKCVLENYNLQNHVPLSIRPESIESIMLNHPDLHHLFFKKTSPKERQMFTILKDFFQTQERAEKINILIKTLNPNDVHWNFFIWNTLLKHEELSAVYDRVKLIDISLSIDPFPKNAANIAMKRLLRLADKEILVTYYKVTEKLYEIDILAEKIISINPDLGPLKAEIFINIGNCPRQTNKLSTFAALKAQEIAEKFDLDLGHENCKVRWKTTNASNKVKASCFSYAWEKMIYKKRSNLMKIERDNNEAQTCITEARTENTHTDPDLFQIFHALRLVSTIHAYRYNPDLAPEVIDLLVDLDRIGEMEAVRNLFNIDPKSVTRLYQKALDETSIKNKLERTTMLIQGYMEAWKQNR